MNKTTLIEHIAKKTNSSQDETKNIVNSIFEELSSLLAKQKSLTITGFGTFSVIKKEKRKGFNPAIDKFMMLPPKLKAKFKPTESLKEKVNKDE